ncbi:MAG: OmpA family protein [Bacteroidia bacterium]|nr:OmpA family protein [Bacteroidia bacterium]
MLNKTKGHLLSVLLCLFSGLVTAQDFLGLHNNNYSGVVTVFSNPANIADSRMQFDLLLGGVNTSVDNNYVGIKRSALEFSGSIFNPKTIRFPFQNANTDSSDANYYKNSLVIYPGDNNVSAYSSSRLVIASFMFNLDRKSALALTMSVRNHINLDGMSRDLANAAYNEFKDPSLFLKNFKSDDITAAQMTWADYGLSYARVIKDKEKHFLKAGLTAKLLQGAGAGYYSIRNLEYVIDTVNVYSFISSDLSYGFSQSYDEALRGGSVDLNKIKYSFGFGFDIGAVYEWRPDFQEYKYNMDGETDLWRRDQNKYKLKASLSINDIGGIKYKKSQYSNDVSATFNYWDFTELNVDSFAGFDKLMKDSFPSTSNSTTFKVSLPTTINTQVDYHLGKCYYVNFTANLPNPIKTKSVQLYEYTNLSLGPRIDLPWFGLSVPFTYNSLVAQHGKPVMMGLGLRLGPLSIGTNDILNYFTGDFYGMNAYMLLRLPIPYMRVKDMDKDNISDRLDKCKEVPGIWEFVGCPDKDGDHVQDSEDLCPEVPGLKELQGCPDKDGDGITDAKDACPDSAGTVEFQGCPDRDGDKIIDRLDTCPDVAGLLEFHGCPDKDADGTMDKEDLCPDIFGPKEYKGCPDRDADKILDLDDQCPDVAGPAENKGCPWPDTDKDGILDKDDSCKTVVGLPQFNGCPPPPPPQMKAAEKRILEKAFASLEFATGKDVILAKSFASLNALAKLLIEHKDDWTLKLSGHTDNQGDPEKNMLLSEKRAKAVEKYLVKKGAFDEKIEVEWFGQTQPIADNNTPKGRQKNRRVEMKISYVETVEP